MVQEDNRKEDKPAVIKTASGGSRKKAGNGYTDKQGRGEGIQEDSREEEDKNSRH